MSDCPECGRLRAENERQADELRQVKPGAMFYRMEGESLDAFMARSKAPRVVGIDYGKPGGDCTVLGMRCHKVDGMTSIAVIPGGVDIRLEQHNGKPYALLVAPWMPPALISLSGDNVQQRIDEVCKR